MSKDSDQTPAAPRLFKLGPLGNLTQVTNGLAKTIRAMADGTLDSQLGARICNGLGIMRACFETQQKFAVGEPDSHRTITKVVHEFVHVNKSPEELSALNEAAGATH